MFVVFVFFGFNPMLRIEIIVLWLTIYETYVKFARLNKIMGYLFPLFYMGEFTAVLNGSNLVNNR
jgi:tryptophan-rich sensory protein